ncbi:hypothetical protein Thiowin_04310 [Thiorhodovibrio winogradskyi]|uniref:DUF1109 domain-containing protein n=1 Tax=Thiorhodovibrio winogradskyi TaxID=77007 RepID=A0ABZ0SFP4_9GAMM|nr:DUF1109 domain-containing protein [Thiorhodovibrio winogradskyi]
MKTSHLIDLLATEAGPAPRALPARRIGAVVPFGWLASIAATLVLLGPIPASLWAEPAPWIKLAYAGGLASGALWLTTRLARPVARTGGPVISIVAVVILMALLGLTTLLAAPASERLAALLGHSWARCPVNVLLLSLPTLAGALWALRGLAPTQARAAGLAAGLLAGAVGAMAYALSCIELSAAFVALWYSLGIALAGGLGALMGPWLLRW